MGPYRTYSFKNNHGKLIQKGYKLNNVIRSLNIVLYILTLILFSLKSN